MFLVSNFDPIRDIVPGYAMPDPDLSRLREQVPAVTVASEVTCGRAMGIFRIGYEGTGVQRTHHLRQRWLTSISSRS
jgi:hypothetical protein